MEREDAVQYIVDEFGSSTESLITRMAIPTTDTGAMKTIIDNALLALGVVYSDLASGVPSNVLGYRATLKYKFLLFAWHNRMATDLLGTLQSGSGARISVEAWRAEIGPQLRAAWGEAVGAGVPLSDPDGSATDDWAALITAYGKVGYDLNYLGCG